MVLVLNVPELICPQVIFLSLENGEQPQNMHRIVVHGRFKTFTRIVIFYIITFAKGGGTVVV